MTTYHRSPATLYPVTFTDRQGDIQCVEGYFETPKAAHRFAAKITWGTDVAVWQGQPGGVRC